MLFHPLRKITISGAMLAILALTLLTSPSVSAQSIDELKQKIEDRNANIQKLEQEISQYQTQVEAVGKEAKTLQSTVKALDLNEKKLNTDIKVTEDKITAANYTIEKTNLEITNTEGELDKSLSSLAGLIRSIHESDDSSVLEILLSRKDISEFLGDVEIMEKLQKGIRDKMALLQSLKSELEARRNENSSKKTELLGFKEDLGDKKKIVTITKAEKSTLLQSTQSKEANYKKTLAEKTALKNAFEQELLTFESQLKIAVDPNSYSKPQKGVLAYPIDNVIITQYFGNTAFAQSGAYNGQGHNGVDFGAPIGTPIKSAGDGIVMGTGDTDLVCPNASFGRWILIQHNNGLSTLYGHLSLIKVSKGEEVTVGELIAYSGNTGYTTGPHLHFTVYATQGVQILERKSAVCGGTYVMPIADLKAYLNPLSYL